MKTGNLLQTDFDYYIDKTNDYILMLIIDEG